MHPDPTPPWLPAVNVQPDDAPMGTVLATLRLCAQGWAPTARLVGNVRAGDIVRALDEAEAQLRQVDLAIPPPLPRLQVQDWQPEILDAWAAQLAQLKGQRYGNGDDPDCLGVLEGARRVLAQLACAVRAEGFVPEQPTNGTPRTPRL